MSEPSFERPIRLFVAGHRPQRFAALAAQLRTIGLDIVDAAWGDIKSEMQPTSDCDILLCEAQSTSQAAREVMQLRTRMGEHYTPILLVWSADGMEECPIGIADGICRFDDSAERVAATVAGLARGKRIHDKARSKTAEVLRANRRLMLATQQIDDELALARSIQECFLPHSMPPLPCVRIHSYNEVACGVSGDFHDIFSLDDHTVALYLADVMGHGVPAALLTLYMKRAISPWGEVDGTSRRLAPHEVLERFNSDLIERNLTENPFVTAVYMTVDAAAKELQIARGGHPHPLLVRPSQPVREIGGDGTLLGIFVTDYETQTVDCQSGDKVLLYTDGVDQVRYRDCQQGQKSLISFVQDRSELSVEDLIAAIRTELFPSDRHDDDLTLLGLQFE